MRLAQPMLPFQGFDTVEFEAICAAGRVLELADGDVLFHRGDAGDSMYILEAGRIDLQFVEGDDGKVLKAGEVLGELAFLTGDRPRSATARAVEECRLRVLDQSAVEALFEAHPRLLIRLLRSTCIYLLDSEDRLISSLRRRNGELEKTLDYLRRTREEVDHQELLANTDALTGLYNRRCFDLQFAKAIHRAKDSGTGLALLLVDLDHFKKVNDTLGHAVGDDVLRQAGELLRTSVRTSDLPCRFGGDEFALVLSEIDAERAWERARDLRVRIAEIGARIEGTAVRITASVGGGMLGPDEAAADLFNRVDGYLYEAKEAGRNRVTWNV